MYMITPRAQQSTGRPYLCLPTTSGAGWKNASKRTLIFILLFYLFKLITIALFPEKSRWLSLYTFVEKKGKNNNNTICRTCPESFQKGFVCFEEHLTQILWGSTRLLDESIFQFCQMEITDDYFRMFQSVVVHQILKLRGIGMTRWHASRFSLA